MAARKRSRRRRSAFTPPRHVTLRDGQGRPLRSTGQDGGGTRDLHRPEGERLQKVLARAGFAEAPTIAIDRARRRIASRSGADGPRHVRTGAPSAVGVGAPPAVAAPVGAGQAAPAPWMLMPLMPAPAWCGRSPR